MTNKILTIVAAVFLTTIIGKLKFRTFFLFFFCLLRFFHRIEIASDQNQFHHMFSYNNATKKIYFLRLVHTFFSYLLSWFNFTAPMNISVVRLS